MRILTLVVVAMSVSMGCSDPEEQTTGSERQPVTPVPIAPQFADTGPPLEAPSNAAEQCDGLDNDQDGQVDESGCGCMANAECYGGPPHTRNVGQCRDGSLVCDGSNEFIIGCEEDIRPSDEVCDGLDQDCDGQVDESCCDADPSCEPVSETFIVDEETIVRPTDFVMVVDNSGSMRDTAAAVRNNLGDFSERLVEAGIDYTFTVIAQKGRSGTNICVEPPMGGVNCENAPRFRHIDKRVSSNSALMDLASRYAAGLDAVNPEQEYKSMLRPGALLQLISVTDDESRMSWEDFRNTALATDFPELVFHAVVGLQRGGCVASVGEQYIEGAHETGGAQLSVCDADWGHVLDVILDTTLQLLTASFELTHAPIPESIRVYRGPERRPVLDGWQYIEETNLLQFQSDAVPPANTVVHVEYDRML